MEDLEKTFLECKKALTQRGEELYTVWVSTWEEMQKEEKTAGRTEHFAALRDKLTEVHNEGARIEELLR